jgi:hypothetical protein
MICSICTEICSSNEMVMNCGHIFHENCMMKWLEVGSSCPNCRLQTPLTKQIYLQANICGCGSCTMLFEPTEIYIWIDDDTNPLCPHCFVDCVYPFSKDCSVDKIIEFLSGKNMKSYEGIVYIKNQIMIKGDVVYIVNNTSNNGIHTVLTQFYRSKSKSFDEYITSDCFRALKI